MILLFSISFCLSLFVSISLAPALHTRYQDIGDSQIREDLSYEYFDREITTHCLPATPFRETSFEKYDYRYSSSRDLSSTENYVFEKPSQCGKFVSPNNLDKLGPGNSLPTSSSAE